MQDKNVGKLTEYIVKRRKQKDNELKYDFMPSLLEIIERPAHMAGKVIIVSIALLLILIICYASVAKMDIIVTGQGQIGGTKKMLNISAEYSGKISEVNVKAGDYVNAGDVLIALDTEDIVINKEMVTHELGMAEVEREILSLYNEDKNTVIDMTQYDIKYHQLINMLVLQNELHLKEVENSYYSSEELLYLERKVQINERLSELDNVIEQYKNTILQYDNQIKGMSIVSSIDGYVSELNVTGVGENVIANSTLAIIIPNENDFLFEGYISDKDISQVSVGDNVQIKLSSYSFSDYGAIYGEITEISKNTQYIEGLGNVYTLKVVLDEDLNENIKIEYGMSGTMEVMVGKRTLMEYFMEPIRNGLDNSLKEK